MNIIGTGIDIVEIARIKRLLESQVRAKRKLFTPEEIQYCEKKTRKYWHYAARFAAKEAVYKAVNDQSLTLKKITITNSLNGKPEVTLHGKEHEEIEVHVSLSHSHNYAIAHAIAVKKESERRKVHG